MDDGDHRSLIELPIARALPAMQALASRLWTPEARHHPGQLAWSYAYAEPEALGHGPAALLDRDEEVVAWAWAELALAQSEPARALRITEQLIASAPGDLMGQPIPHLLVVKGEALLTLNRLEAALAALERALAGAEQRQALPLLPRIHWSLGRVSQT